MSKLKTALEKVRLALAEDAAAAEGATPEPMKAKDGKMYKVGKLEAGETIEEVSATDGTLTPVADGDIEFEDGTIVTVKEGKIEAVKAPEAMADDAAAAAAKEKEKPAPDAAKPEVTKADFDTLTTTVSGLADTIAALVAKNGLQMQAMFELVEASSEESTEVVTGEKKHSAFSTAKTEVEKKRETLKGAFTALIPVKKS